MLRTARLSGSFLFALVLGLGAAWTALAIRVHVPGSAQILAFGALVLAIVLALVARRRARRAGWAVVALAGCLVAGLYATIRPSETRDWAVDVQRGVKARVSGEIVTLSDLRDFDWETRDKAIPRWIERQYDLSALRSVDMITSSWSNPDIAHLLVSFGFDGGEQVVFSVEIRREADEAFNELGGFFRQFELVLIGATEGDAVRLRSELRGEDVRLYPVELSAARRRALFLSYVALAQELERAPAFYNTLTANCTTTVYRLARSLHPDLPLDRRLILSGRLPAYLDELGVLGGEGPLPERQAAARIAPGGHPAAGYSDRIRRR